MEKSYTVMYGLSKVHSVTKGIIEGFSDIRSMIIVITGVMSRVGSIRKSRIGALTWTGATIKEAMIREANIEETTPRRVDNAFLDKKEEDFDEEDDLSDNLMY